MRVAVTGATGFIGSYLVRHLAGAGHRVSALVRAGGRRDHIAAFIDRLVEGDHRDEACWPALLEGSECVIHGSVERGAWEPDHPDPLNVHLESNLVGSIRLLRASSPRQFVFISSMAVHMDMSHNRVSQDGEHPLPGSYYAAYKSAVESHVRAERADGRRTVVVRPCRCYGMDPNLRRSEGYELIETLRRGEAIRRPGWGRWVHVEDVAAAIRATVGNEAAYGRSYDLVDCYARFADWARMAAEVLGVRAEIDLSGPAAPTSSLTAGEARLLGVGFDRGEEGIRRHLKELAAVMGAG